MPFVTIKDDLKFYYDLFPQTESPEKILHSNSSAGSKKPLVLLLHPRFLDSDFFGFQVNDTRITDKYNLLTIDTHWHGRTEVPVDDEPYDFERVSSEIFQVLDALGVKSLYISGIALGSLLAVKMAMLQPSRILGLMLCSMPGPVETLEQLVEHRVILEAALQKAEDGSDIFCKELLNAARWVWYGQKEVETEEQREKFMAATRFRPSNKRLVMKVYSILLDRQAPPQSDWDKIRCRVLLIQGGNDILYPPKIAQDNYNLLRNAQRELVIVDGAPHLLNRSHHEKINQLFLEFMARC